ncbi:spore germination protein [Virgibacillus sp. AGTR]|uniref:spore germination protein n=1 Tax=Virgibacillus TaxID=84406 RepID=UPI0003F912B8|nr:MULTISPECIES: spore germination protein [Bacillaceae]MCC2248872.1 spore germination protein [Virgibacillus sp. AGTR]
MPSIIGPIKVNRVGRPAIINFGDSFYVAPKRASDTNSGSGSLNTGDFINSNSGFSTTNPYDSDINDKNVTSNA